jgi:hypothetical protein
MRALESPEWPPLQTRGIRVIGGRATVPTEKHQTRKTIR